MWTRAELKENAKQLLRVNYWPAVVAALVYTIAAGSSGGSSTSASSNSGNYDSGTVAAILIAALMVLIVTIVLKIFVFNPLAVGAIRFFANGKRGTAQLSDLGMVFKSGYYVNTVKVMFLRDLFVGLWTLLFIIPGIIKAYEYFFIPYLLSDNPGLDSDHAFARTKQMTDGQKMDIFVLDLSFIGWVILSVFTCGILAIFYVNPYILFTKAELYHKLGGYDGTAQFNNPYGGGYAQPYGAPAGQPYAQPYAQPQGYADPYAQPQGYADPFAAAAPAPETPVGMATYTPPVAPVAPAPEAPVAPSYEAPAAPEVPSYEAPIAPEAPAIDPGNPMGTDIG